ncbi:MAG: DNA primase, partial [Leptospira sp.]|nr:DNA primase [Leptospira sp.]
MQSNTDFTDRVHREVSIDAYISRYVNLKRQGNRLVGLCPFHTEKTPSFQVSPERGVYHCFGCHKSGDIFRFVMDFDRVDFNRAKEILSAYSGIPVKSFSSAETSGKNEKIRLFELNKKIMDYYSKNLHSSDGHGALEYLSSRNLSEASIRF